MANLPVHSLKIDQSFVAKLTFDDKSAAIIKAILSLGQNLGVSVIAEGIETQEQLDYLRTAGCHYGQGYFFTGPVAAEVIGPVLAGVGG